MFSLALRKIRKNADSVCFCNYPCIYCIYWKRLHLCKIYRELTLCDWIYIPTRWLLPVGGRAKLPQPFFSLPDWKVNRP
jgi:hypothetical protein